ncbi:hypothetical protein GE09DRAFT_1168330 [Coniochaeta sp. 2T2.1]|nr:hypothetical protein GE09DRAFT_1168330 [Coniochaeta sp. 2T2.1]
MDSMYSDRQYEESHSQTHRSRTDSGVSTTQGLLESLNLVESPPETFDSVSYPRSTSHFSQGAGSPIYITSALPTPSTFLPTSSSQPLSTYPHISEPVLDADWFHTSNTTTDAPLLRIESTPGYSRQRISSTPSPRTTQPASMSTVALQYDPTFNMAGRSSFTWPVMESANLLGHDLGSYASDVSLSPPHGSRSVTASPPRGILTAEQRELKRQRDQARRDSKMSQRQRRADSSSSSYVHSPPVSMADLTTAASSLPIYTTAPSQISVLAEPVSTVASQQYMPSYSPPLESQSNMFSNQYSSQPYMQMGYSSNYQNATSSSLPSHYGRPSMADPNMMYPMPPAMSTGGQAGQEGTHVRVVQSRPKPQCWEHGCNGRQFSTFSNLLRHQREKSGHAAKASCPNCGAEFTRTTARNGHLLHDKCKQKRNSTSSQ